MTALITKTGRTITSIVDCRWLEGTRTDVKRITWERMERQANDAGFYFAERRELTDPYGEWGATVFLLDEYSPVLAEPAEVQS